MVPLDTNGEPGTRATERDAVSALEYYSTGVVSFVASLLCLALVYAPVVQLARPLHLLSTTAVVTVFLTLWALTWLVLEVLWEWRTGRLTEV